GFTYDSAGRRASSIDQLGHKLTYHYDTAGRLEIMTNEFGAEVVHCTYDTLGRLGRKVAGNTVFTDYGYDAAGQLLRMTNSLANGTTLSFFNYIYDSRGRRTSMDTMDGRWSYEYDDLGQLTHAVLASVTTNISNQDLTYVYDPLGNRLWTLENGRRTDYQPNN